MTVLRDSHSELGLDVVVKEAHEHEDSDDHHADSDGDGDDTEEGDDTTDDGEEDQDEEDDPNDLVHDRVLSVGDLLVEEECDNTDDDVDYSVCEESVVEEAADDLEDSANDAHHCEDLDELADDVEFVVECSAAYAEFVTDYVRSGLTPDPLCEGKVEESSDEGSHCYDDVGDLNVASIDDLPNHGDNGHHDGDNGKDEQCKTGMVLIIEECHAHMM